MSPLNVHGKTTACAFGAGRCYNLARPSIEKAGVAPRQPSSLLYSEACLALACFLAAARSPMGRARILLPAENSLSEFAFRFIVLGEPYNGEPCRHDL